MATRQSDSGSTFSDTGICNCSICLEQFKTPKYLPCLHTFCEACLHSCIISFSKSGKTTPKFFNCPMCRAEVKPPDPSISVEEWAKSMPKNHMINFLMDKEKSSKNSTEKYECNPCKFDGENIYGEHWCCECQEFLCDRCKKEHIRHKSSRSHKLVPAIDAGKQETKMAAAEVEEPCTEHKGEMLKVYCIDHQKMCCVLCLSIIHKRCENVKTFDEMTDDLKQNGEIEQLLDNMKQMESKAEIVSKRKRENVTSIQNQRTTILGRTNYAIQKTKAKLDRCHEEFKEQVSYRYKEETTKLLDAADKLDSIQTSITDYQKICRAVTETGSSKSIFVTF